MNSYIKIFLCTALVLLFSGCSWLMIGSHPKPSSYKYYSKDFKLSSNTAIRTDGFYYYNYITKNNDELYYSYLRFYDDGRINSNSTKEPPELIKESNWPFNDVYGYYYIDDNDIAYELKSRYGTYRHGEGAIIGDTISLKVFDMRNNGDTIYYCKYVFHSFYE